MRVQSYAVCSSLKILILMSLEWRNSVEDCTVTQIDCVLVYYFRQMIGILAVDSNI